MLVFGNDTQTNQILSPALASKQANTHKHPIVSFDLSIALPMDFRSLDKIPITALFPLFIFSFIIVFVSDARVHRIYKGKIVDPITLIFFSIQKSTLYSIINALNFWSNIDSCFCTFLQISRSFFSCCCWLYHCFAIHSLFPLVCQCYANVFIVDWSFCYSVTAFIVNKYRNLIAALNCGILFSAIVLS